MPEMAEPCIACRDADYHHDRAKVWSEAANEARDAAGKAYRDDRDEAASWLRKLSDTFAAHASEDKNYAHQFDESASHICRTSSKPESPHA